MLAAILKPSSGWVEIDGLDVVKHAQAVRSRVGLLTEYPGLYGRMRALDYLCFFGELVGLTRHQCEQRATRLLQRFGLWDVRDRPLESYSKGMRQKLALVRSLLHDPPVLFLDEPSTAMDPQSARTVRDAIGELRAANRTILLTTHNLAEAEALADRIAIVNGGRVIAEGTRTQLMQQLMGTPMWELRLTTPAAAERARKVLAEFVYTESIEGNRLRYRCADPLNANPYILARLVKAGVQPVALHEISRSLEDMYLAVVERQHEWLEERAIGEPSHALRY
jgi:ABC-2 type transport system ATP-binding protein